jgi:hypothetical protein
MHQAGVAAHRGEGDQVANLIEADGFTFRQFGKKSAISAQVKEAWAWL